MNFFLNHPGQGLVLGSLLLRIFKCCCTHFHDFTLQYVTKKPSLKVCRGMELKLNECHAASLGGSSLASSSSDSGSDA